MNSVFIDNNILIAASDIGHVHYIPASECFKKYVLNKTPLCINLQVMAEYWNVATRPVAQNGIGQSLQTVRKTLDDFLQVIHVLPDTPDMHLQWLGLIEKYTIMGKAVHDARIATTMQVHQISKIMTLNKQDFVRYPDFEIINPLEQS